MVVIIPLTAAYVGPGEFVDGKPAILFRCDPDCMTVALDRLSDAVEKLSSGRAGELIGASQGGDFAIGCHPDRCAPIREAIAKLAGLATAQSPAAEQSGVPPAALEIVARIEGLTNGFEYWGTIPPDETIAHVRFESSKRSLLLGLDRSTTIVIPLAVVQIDSELAEFDDKTLAIRFACDPACITLTTEGFVDSAKTLASGSATDVDAAEQMESYALGCARDRCAPLQQAIGELVEFAKAH